MSIGDIHSTQRGSGARFNSGKPPMDLVPLGAMAGAMAGWLHLDMSRNPSWRTLDWLAEFQAGHDAALLEAMGHMPMAAWRECAQVFDYGRTKYAAWNWAKGMPWSVPIACAARHLMAIIGGEENDPESGLPHRGHVLCNLVMLSTYMDTYREGDDRPKGLLSKAENCATPQQFPRPYGHTAP